VPTAKDPTVLMSVVAPDEPEGYRGRRRHLRFPFVGRAGGAAVPALLVAASVVVVLIVVGVSQLLPKQAAGQIPFGSPPGAVSDNNGQGTNDPGTGTGDGPSGSSSGGSTKPGKSPGAKPSGSSSPGTGPGGTPTDPGNPTETPTQTPTTPPAKFNPVTLQAESAALSGGAYSSTTSCTSCLGGSKVRNVGKTSSTVNGVVTVSVTTPAAGDFKITISFELSGSRNLSIDINGGGTKNLALSGTSWGSPGSTTVTVALKSGANSIRFYNSAAAAPDLDQFKIEQA
jgi:hypothetical protein